MTALKDLRAKVAAWMNKAIALDNAAAAIRALKSNPERG